MQGSVMDALELPEGFDVCNESEAAKLLETGFIYIGVDRDVDRDEVEKKNFIRLVKIKRRDWQWATIGYFAKAFTEVQTVRAKYCRKLNKMVDRCPSDNASLLQWSDAIGELVTLIIGLPDNVHPYPNEEPILILQ